MDRRRMVLGGKEDPLYIVKNGVFQQEGFTVNHKDGDEADYGEGLCWALPLDGIAVRYFSVKLNVSRYKKLFIEYGTYTWDSVRYLEGNWNSGSTKAFGVGSGDTISVGTPAGAVDRKTVEVDIRSCKGTQDVIATTTRKEAYGGNPSISGRLKIYNMWLE